MNRTPDPTTLTVAEKADMIIRLLEQVTVLAARVAELEAKLADRTDRAIEGVRSSVGGACRFERSQLRILFHLLRCETLTNLGQRLV